MRLTPLAKLFIASVVIAVVGYTGWHYSRSRVAPVVATPTASTDGAASNAAGEAKSPGTKRDPKKIVIGVNDFGGAYPGVVANDGAIAGAKSRFKAAGLDVEIKLIRGSKERLEAFDSGQVDIMLLTLDYLANLVPVYREKGVELKAFFMADWSRGNMGIVSKPAITSIEGLRDAKIATTRNTPTHYFLLSLLKKSNLKPEEIERVKGNLVFATKTPQAGEMFKRGEVDAVAIWEPHLSQAMAGGKGKLLVSTETATNLVADVLFARQDWLAAHESDLPLIIKAWLEGVAALKKDPDAGVKTIAAAFKQTEEETRGVLSKIKPATFADNRAFMGLDRERCAYVSQFEDASRVWVKEGVIKSAADARPTRWMKALETVQKDYADEKIVEAFQFTSAPKADATALLTKSVSIYFPSGAFEVGPNAKTIVDSFAETLTEFGNAYVRVEGNTDDKGARTANLALSKKRAAAVVDYLVAKHGLDRARLIAVGNGPDKSVGDNKTEAGRELNRRTDFAIIPNQ